MIYMNNNSKNRDLHQVECSVCTIPTHHLQTTCLRCVLRKKKKKTRNFFKEAIYMVLFVCVNMSAGLGKETDIRSTSSVSRRRRQCCVGLRQWLLSSIRKLYIMMNFLFVLDIFLIFVAITRSPLVLPICGQFKGCLLLLLLLFCILRTID